MYSVSAQRLFLWTWLLTWGAGAAVPGAPTQSASGQFSVLSPDPSSPRVASAPLLADSDLLHVDPTLLTVSAERLRQHLVRELQDSSPWEDRILFSLRPAQGFDAPVEMIAEWHGDGWRYRVFMPEYLAHDRFVRALVEVNLMEMANRTSSGRASEVPAWLTEGLTAQLLASRAIEIILPPPRLKVGKMQVTPWVVEERKYQPLATAQLQLSTNTPLTIEQLSWPAPNAFVGRRGEIYRHCSHLLLTRLLQLPDGHALLNAYIRNLSRHYNWQVAFLDTYSQLFPSLLDLEKWWALQVADFTGRELGDLYSYTKSVRQLKQTVRFPVEVRLETNDLPMHGDAPLQTIIREWEGNQQRMALEQVVAKLTLLRARIAPELVALLDDYRLTLGNYLNNRDRMGIYLPKGANRQAAMNRLMGLTLRRLNRQDAELASLMPENEEESALAGNSP
jgi:hypothetical protein